MPEYKNNKEKSRFELLLDGKLIGHIDYRIADGTMDMYHTEISPDVGGQGYGSKIVKYALDEARKAQLEVIPTCSFVASYIERHP